jgi:uncharacterized protein (TIGR02145 family)
MKSSNSSSYSDTNEGINFSGLFGSAPTIWYPASGYRSYNNGNLKDVGNLGRYWSGSPSTTTDNAFYMLFDYYANAYPSISEDRANGYSVRCVRE